MSNLVHNNEVLDSIKDNEIAPPTKKKKSRKKRKKRSKKEKDANKIFQSPEQITEDETASKRRKTSDDKDLQEKSPLLPFLKNIPSLLVSDVEDITLPVSQNIGTDSANTEDKPDVEDKVQDIEEGEILNEDKDKAQTKKSKKKSKKTKKAKTKTSPVCNKWIIGKCYKKDECPFLHQGEQIKSTEICKFFRTGSCSRGEKCLYSHDLKSEACKFLASRGVCGKGDECPYSHDPELIKKAIQLNIEKEKERKELESQSQIPKEISSHLINFQRNTVA